LIFRLSIEPIFAVMSRTVWFALGAYFLIGTLVCFTHPLLLRKALTDLKGSQFQSRNILIKPILGFVTCLLYITLWPIGWFNAGKSEKKANAALDAQYERLRPFLGAHAAMNAKVTYAGGDGSSFAQAIIVLDANLLSGPRAEYDFIERHYPGSKVGRQSLKEENQHKYDVLDFVTVAGERKTLYFDISDSFRPDFRANF
jgi:hypothetical protein